jgi:hypothetical protein
VGDADAATDQFALAVIAYEMLTGRNPFQADTSGEVFALVLHTDPPPMGLGRYLRVDWSHLWVNMYDIREYTWSLRMVTWFLAAGAIALARRSATVGILIGGWLLSYLVLKGSASGVDVKSGAFFRYMVPAFPPFFLGVSRSRCSCRSSAGGSSRPARPSAPGPSSGSTGACCSASRGRPGGADPRDRRVPAAHRAGRDGRAAREPVRPDNTFPLAARELADGSIALSWPSQTSAEPGAVCGLPRPRIGFRALRRRAATFCRLLLRCGAHQARPDRVDPGDVVP